jgi:hypothetical protein
LQFGLAVTHKMIVPKRSARRRLRAALRVVNVNAAGHQSTRLIGDAKTQEPTRVAAILGAADAGTPGDQQHTQPHKKSAHHFVFRTAGA